MTDHDLLQVVNKWAKDLPNEEIIGIRTAFAVGFRYAEKLYLHAVMQRSEQLISLLEKLLENNMCSHSGDELIEQILKEINCA